MMFLLSCLAQVHAAFFQRVVMTPSSDACTACLQLSECTFSSPALSEAFLNQTTLCIVRRSTDLVKSESLRFLSVWLAVRKKIRGYDVSASSNCQSLGCNFGGSRPPSQSVKANTGFCNQNWQNEHFQQTPGRAATTRVIHIVLIFSSVIVQQWTTDKTKVSYFCPATSSPLVWLFCL